MRDTGPVNTNRYNNCRNVGAMREADAAVTEESIIVVTATHDKIYKAATVAVALLLLVGAAAAWVLLKACSSDRLAKVFASHIERYTHFHQSWSHAFANAIAEGFFAHLRSRFTSHIW
jgi:hypothetical protein